jgi:LysR family glycine cleavage system transcriptional activator
MLQAAVDGQGFAMGRRALVEHDLAAGRLVRPFPLSLPCDQSYYLVASEQTAELPKVKAFRSWILAEAAADDRS